MSEKKQGHLWGKTNTKNYTSIEKAELFFVQSKILLLVILMVFLDGNILVLKQS